jgi:hypothetical protein
MDFEAAKTFILDKLRKELSPVLYYHDINHTLDVYRSVERIAAMENVTGADLILLKTAALFHDSGMLTTYVGHEEASCRFTEIHLPHFGYSPDEIIKINKMILATKLPQRASGLMEQILCDADLDYLGRNDFFMISHRLKFEWKTQNIKPTTLKEWYILQINFLEGHSFFTRSAILSREEKKQENLMEIKEIMNHYNGQK